MQLITQTPQRGPSPTQVVGLLGGGLPQLYAQGQMPMRYARGGVASAAQQLSRKGRHGDSMLVHMQPKEVAGLATLARRHGKRLTINPHTGLPEAWGLSSLTDWVGDAVSSVGDFAGDLLGGVGDVIGDVVDWGGDILGDIGGGIMDLANGIAEGLGPIGNLAAYYFGGPAGVAIYSGFQAPGEGFDAGAAARAGATSFVGGDLMGGGGGDTTASFDYAGEFGNDPFGLNPANPPSLPPELQLQNIPSAAADLPPPITYDGSGIGEPTEQFAQAPTTSDVVPVDVTGDVGAATVAAAPITDISVPFDPVAYSAISTGQGVADLGSAGIEALKRINLNDLKNIAQIGAAGMTAYGGYSALQEQKKMKAEAERLRAAQEKKRAEQQAFAESVLKRYPLNYRNFTAEDVKKYNMAIGGSVPPAMPMANIFDRDDGMAKGGIASVMPPRFLSGGGDGMSDSIRANIEGKQEARLADGEFVIPADVVSHIGNGSSNAGAKKLYAMMDRVRQARTGKERQAPQVNTRRLLPA